MREIAHEKFLLGFFFWVLPTPYSLGHQIDFHAQYLKRRGSAQRCAFSVLENQNLTFNPSYSPKPPFWGQVLTGLREFSAENRFKMGDVPYKLPLIVIVAPYKL